MSSTPNRDFASLLDDLFVSKAERDAEDELEAEEEAGARPTIPFDYLSVAEELHSGRIRVSGEAVAAEYQEVGAGLEAELEAILKDAAPVEARLEDALPSLEPEAIARELGLQDGGDVDLSRARRSFALRNHPDRVAPHLRQRALARMQVANGLIDEAKRRALAKAKG